MARNVTIDKAPKIKGFIELLSLFICVAGVAFIPIFMRASEWLHISPKIYPDVMKTKTILDFFGHRWYLFIAVCIISVAILLYKVIWCNCSIKKSFINPALIGLLSVMFISFASSDYKSISFFGHEFRREGILTYMAYFGLFFSVAQIDLTLCFKTFTHSKNWLFYALALVTITNFVFGFMNYIGVPLNNVDTFQQILHPGLGSGRLTFNMNMTSTFDNPNYASGLAGAMTLFWLTVCLYAKTKAGTFVSLALSALALFHAVLLYSTSGTFTVAFFLPIIIVASIYLLGYKRVISLIAVYLMLIISIGGIMQLINHNFAKSVVAEFTGTFTSSAKTNASVNTNEDASVTQNSAIEDGDLTDVIPRFPEASVSAGSGRIYVWRKSLSLIAERPIWGYGNDSLGYFFTFDDPEMLAEWGSFNTVADKPHNFYLALALYNGIPMLFVFLSLVLIHFFVTIKQIYLRHKNGKPLILTVSLFVFWMAFLMQFIANDSIFSTSMIFWIFFGLSVSLNTQSQIESLA